MKVRLSLLAACAAWMVGLTLGAPASDGTSRELDFWVGEWEVEADGKFDGTNRIEKVLGGAAVLEHWHGADGHEGKSWFYFYPAEHRWKQIWVTDIGGVKEKAQVETQSGGAVRFRGEMARRDGTKLLDQTTLTPGADGTVRQVIEQSADGGRTWRVVYDAVYRRKKSP